MQSEDIPIAWSKYGLKPKGDYDYYLTLLAKIGRTMSKYGLNPKGD